MSDTENNDVDRAGVQEMNDLGPTNPSEDDSDTGHASPNHPPGENKENTQEPMNTRFRGKRRQSENDTHRHDEIIAKLQRKLEDEKKKYAEQLKKQEDDKKKFKQQIKKFHDSDTKNRAEISQLQGKLDDSLSDVGTLSAQLVSAQSNLKEKEDELSDMHKLVIERDEEIEELMTQLVKSSEAPKENVIKPIGVVITDEISRPIVNELTPKVKWEISSSPDWALHASRADLCLILLGSEEINKGRNSVHVFNLIRDFVNDKNRECELAVVSVPVHKQKPHSIQLKLLNFQISELAKESDRFIFINPTAPRTDPYEGNHLADQTVTLWASTINTELVIPSPKPRECASSLIPNAPFEDGSLSQIVQVPKEALGPIIGKKGHSIREITSQFDVKLSVGKWFERTKGSVGNQEYTERSDAIVITGQFSRTQKCADKLKQLANESTKLSSDEPDLKKFKF